MLDRLNAIKFVMMVSFVSSLLLAFIYTTAKSTIDDNIASDKKQSILKSIGIDVLSLNAMEIDSIYDNHIEEWVINKEGKKVDDILALDIIWEENQGTGLTNYIYSIENNDFINEYLPLYVYQSDSSREIEAFIIPVSGKGLWSTLKGYFALSADANTTLGIVFYSHKETPGLGAEVDKPWFQEQFKKDKNKRIFNNENNLVSIKLSRIVAEDDPHKVKGITGATVTTKGVTNLLKRDLDRYRLFLDSRKKK